MAIQPGTALGTFEIIGLLGVGGMGEVYRARDTKLGREIAIKVLPAEVAADTERLLRFEREAKLLAALDHPNIATLHDFRHADGIHFLVMQLVEGETLAERIDRGPIPLSDVLPIFIQIAEALETAHAQDVIHRDLKPANIKVGEDLRVKILDFGIAKSLAPPEAGSTVTPTPSSPDATTLPGTPTPPTSITGEDMLVGTPSYMSPEQARGKRVDKRADIWAFGCCLFQSLTGEKPFSGDTIADTISSVTRDEPNWTKLPSSVPPRLRELIQRCLQKDPRLRLRDIGDAWLELRGILDGPEEAPEKDTRAAKLAVVGFLFACVVGALVVTYGMMLWFSDAETATPGVSASATDSSDARPVRRYTIPSPAEGERVAGRLSPDGSLLAMTVGEIGSMRLYLRSMDALDTRLATPSVGAMMPFFSPDNKRLGYCTYPSGRIEVVLTSGGRPKTIVESTMPLGATWCPDDTIVFGIELGKGLYRVPASGGDPEILTTPNAEAGEMGHRYPDVLPGGKALIFTVWKGVADQSAIAVLSLETMEYSIVVESAQYAVYSRTGHLVFGREGYVFAVGFDLEMLRTIGEPTRIVSGVHYVPMAGVTSFSVGQGGTFVFTPGDESSTDHSLVWVRRDGAAEPIENSGGIRGVYQYPRLSPDGKRVALQVFPVGTNKTDIWVIDLQRGTQSRLSFEGNNTHPVWTPDGEHVLFVSDRSGTDQIYRKRADGSRPAELLETLAVANPELGNVSPDGETLVLSHPVAGTSWDLATVSLNAQGNFQHVLQDPLSQSSPVFSPDGRWLAYVSQETGRFNVFVRAVPDTGGKWQVSTTGGIEPLWSRDGTELFYRFSRKVHRVSVETESGFATGPPEILFHDPYMRIPPRNYDVSPDGQRFLVVDINAEEVASDRIIVVENWTQELDANTTTTNSKPG